MRLWHEDLIPLLPRQQLLGQHRECCALRGKGWGKPHSTVNYVFSYHPYKLYQYHVLVMEEMIARGYQPDSLWLDPKYRGKSAPSYKDLEERSLDCPIYPEHDEVYLQACLMNLKDKGIAI
ncbi:TIGR02328 family protein [Facklamia sp. P12955]|uniref:TIGR02328 family protein n=1 Tax=Facklamia sp. P12955 TaxID=3421946 RepID=UPI003D1782E8